MKLNKLLLILVLICSNTFLYAQTDSAINESSLPDMQTTVDYKPLLNNQDGSISTAVNSNTDKPTPVGKGYRFYIGGDVGIPNIFGGGSVDAQTVLGPTTFTRTSLTNSGVYGSGYFGIESDSGISFEVGAVQIVNKRSEYNSTADLPNISLSQRTNMTVPYFGFGYRIPMYVPDMFENKYTQFLHNVSLKPFVGLRVGIANNIYTVSNEAAAAGMEGNNQTNTAVLPYFKVDIQYKFTEHLYIGCNIGLLLQTQYRNMSEEPAFGPVDINSYNIPTTLLSGVSIKYMF